MRLHSTGLIALLFISHLCSNVLYAQEAGEPLPPGYYIVVAAYRLGQDSYAKSYIDRINGNGIDAKYGADLGRKYLYVYLDYFGDFDISIKEMLATRKKAGFELAWVRIMKDPLAEKLKPIAMASESSNSENIISTSQSKPEETTEVTSEAIESETTELTQPANQVTSEVIAEEPEEEVVESEVEEETDFEEEELPITPPVDLSEAKVFLSLYHSTNNEQIEGEIEVVDTDRSRLIEKIKGNEYVKLPDPKSNSGKLTLLANVFGYRPLQHDIDYTQTAADTLQPFIEWAGNHYLVHFDLVRYHKGDINTLFNVYFFNDAAIMLPESKYQLNNLLAMMNDNEKYRIKLHGHTNGKARGAIITMGPSNSFFSLADDVKKGSGSAKELSHQRALVIKEWLISESIDESRIEVRAWGGGRMLHDQHSVNAKKNVRVDVEIIAE